ncbi:hypothetical protein QBC46DRAFT_407680 [Diplogelasinospora grovesii]|uniref:Uncharacterized protein n=1 Tax=Diplogelasinospora grovesii TaxID=303347 RepID=A0AAN6S5Q3_9PEZI|nr:hypothetical protein QBC46DRAFT_407680 [Diplogelasinospora grovesii]
MDSKYEEEGPVLANRNDSVKKIIRTKERKWIKFCDVLIKERRLIDPAADPVDTDEFLKKCHALTFKAYLYWRCKNSRIKKELSIITYWKVLSIFYSDKCAIWMDGKILFNIENDVFAHEILRTEIALALIITGATATQLSALIEKLCYKDVKFYVFPPTLSSKRARIGMVVTLRKTKRTAGKLKPKKYGFHEEDTLLRHEEDTLLRNPILYMLSLTFADGAFKNDFKSLEDIYDLNVLTG